MVFNKDDERILDNLLKSLSQTETLLNNIVNFTLKTSDKQFSEKCNCKKYFLSRKKYTQYSKQKNALNILVKRCISFKFFCDDVTGNTNYNTNKILNTNSNVNFKINLKPCSNMNIFLKKANAITKLSFNLHILLTQILTFLELVSDILVSICSLPQPESDIEVLSGILVADVYCLHQKYSSLWNELIRVLGNLDGMEKPMIHCNKCKKSRHLSSLFSEFKKQISASLREICKVKFYYNDFVIFLEHFKCRTFHKTTPISETSSIATQTILSNEELYGENDYNLKYALNRSSYESVDEPESNRKKFGLDRIIFPVDSISKKIHSLDVINEKMGDLFSNSLKNINSGIISCDIKNNIVHNQKRSLETLFMNQSMPTERDFKSPKSIIPITNKQPSLIKSNKIVEEIVQFDNPSEEKNKINLFLGTDVNNNKTIEIIKLDKTNQTTNSSHCCNNAISENLFENSIDATTHIILESNQTDMRSGLCESAVNRLLESENMNKDEHSKLNFTLKPLNTAQNQLSKQDMRSSNTKWPVDGYYIPSNYRSKIKRYNCINKYSHHICYKKYGNKNSNLNYMTFKSQDSLKSKQLQYSLNNLGENIHKKTPSMNLTKKSKNMHCLSPKYVKYNQFIPYGVSSCELGLYNIWFKCKQNDYKIYPDELHNLVKNTVYYYNSKTRTGRNEINMESVLTCNNVSDIETSKLSPIENKLSGKAERFFNNLQDENIFASANDFTLFDINGYPLTDIFGNILIDPYGHSVINGALLTSLSNTVVYDASLTPSTSCDFNPYLKKLSNKIGIKLTINNKPLLLFDKYSRPLTDSSGRALLNNEGQILLLFNNIGYPVSDFKGGELYLKNGILWSPGQENIDTVFKRVEKSEDNTFKEPNETAEYRSDFSLNKPEVRDKQSIECIKAKIQERLPVIDDFDFSSPGIKFRTSDLNQDTKENSSLKPFKISEEGTTCTASLISNSSFFQEKIYTDLNNSLNFNVDFHNDKNNKLEVSDSLSKMDDSIFYLNFKANNEIKSSNFETYEHNYKINGFHHKTSVDNILSTSNSIRKVQHITNPVSEIILSKDRFNIEDSVRKRKSNTNEIFDFLDEYLVDKRLPLSDCPNNQNHVLDFIENNSNCKYLECNSNYKSKKFSVDTKIKHHERPSKQNQKLKTGGKLFKTKKQNTHSNKTPNRSNIIQQIYFDSNKNETKPTTFESCFHAPVQFLLGKLDATFSHKNVVIKKEKYNLRENHRIYSNKQKINDKMKAKNNERNDESEKPCKLHLDGRGKLKHKSFENMANQKQIKPLITQNTKTKIPFCGNSNNLFNPASYLVSRKYNFRSKYSSSNICCSFKKSRNSLTKESNVTQLNKFIKPLIPSKILNSPKPSPYSSINKFNLFKQPNKQFNLEENINCFNDKLIILNNRFIKKNCYEN